MLRASRSELGYKILFASIKEEVHLEDDPNYECKIYDQIGLYDQVFEEQIEYEILTT